MKKELENSIGHMVQGLAHWMAFRHEMSNIPIIEADAVLVATDILRAVLPGHYVVDREITHKMLSCISGNKRVDVGIFSKEDKQYKCLIEFKLNDATNGGYKEDVNKLYAIKKTNNDIDCLVVILYRKSCDFNSPKEFLSSNGHATKRSIMLSNGQIQVVVRRVCNSFPSTTAIKSKKSICLEVQI